MVQRPLEGGGESKPSVEQLSDVSMGDEVDDRQPDQLGSNDVLDDPVQRAGGGGQSDETRSRTAPPGNGPAIECIDPARLTILTTGGPANDGVLGKGSFGRVVCGELVVPGNPQVLAPDETVILLTLSLHPY